MTREDFIKELISLAKEIEFTDDNDRYFSLVNIQQSLINEYFGFKSYETGELKDKLKGFCEIFNTLVFRGNKLYTLENVDIKIDFHGVYEGYIGLIELKDTVVLDEKNEHE